MPEIAIILTLDPEKDKEIFLKRVFNEKEVKDLFMQDLEKKK